MGIETKIKIEKKERKYAVYAPPKKIEIAGIPAVVVDPHNEVFSFWYNHFSFWHKHLPGKKAVLFHLDAHSDDGEHKPSIKTFMKTRKDKGFDVEEYAKILGVGGFIVPAFFYGLISRSYFIEPNPAKRLNKTIDVYGFSNGSNPVLEEEGLLLFKRNTRKEILASRLQESLEEDAGLPALMDVDLDFFANRSDWNDYGNDTISASRLKDREKMLKGNYDFFRETLALLPKPGLITIARSQTPCCFVPSDRVDEIQARTIEILTERYR